MSLGRARCPPLWRQLCVAAQPFGVSLTTGGIAPASLGYIPLTPVALTPSWTVYQLTCHQLLPSLRVTFAMVWARTNGLGVPPLLLARWIGWVAPVRPTHGKLFVVSRPSAVLGAHVCAVSVATWRLFTGVRA